MYLESLKLSKTSMTLSYVNILCSIVWVSDTLLFYLFVFILFTKIINMMIIIENNFCELAMIIDINRNRRWFWQIPISIIYGNVLFINITLYDCVAIPSIPPVVITWWKNYIMFKLIMHHVWKANLVCTLLMA